MPQAVDVAQFTFPGEYFLRPFARYAQGTREGAEKFDDLGDMVIVFAVFSARLGIEEIVTGY